jgi:SPP1 family predicted phage head-tail adaptor
MLSQQLNKTIVIEKGTSGVNQVGTPVFIWGEYITTYSKVYVPSGDTRYSQDGQIFTYRTEFTIRYNNDTKLINNKYRINYNGNYYKIVQVQEIGIKEGVKLITVAFNDDGQPEI